MERSPAFLRSDDGAHRRGCQPEVAETELVCQDDLHRFVVELLKLYGVDDAQRNAVARNITWSELSGRTNFGLIRIPTYVQRLESQVLNPQCQAQWEQVSASCARLNGDNGFGHYITELGMRRAIEFARETGIGAVGINNSNFYGTGAYYLKLAADEGMISLALSNSYPKVVAHGGHRAVFGTNPFAFGAPGRDSRHVLVDFATSSLAGSTVREYLENGEQLPTGLAVHPDGEPATDPATIGDAALLPFGGAKGFGLSLMVEILSGVLTGAGFSHLVKSTQTDFNNPSNSGHFLIAIDVRKWMPLSDFYDRLGELEKIIRNSGPSGKVRLPGDARSDRLEVAERDGVRLSTARLKKVEKLASDKGLEVPWRSRC